MMAWKKHEPHLAPWVAAARAQLPPELDLDALSERLVAEFRAAASGGALARSGPPEPVRARRRLSAGWLGLAAACLLGLGSLWLLKGGPVGGEGVEPLAGAAGAPALATDGAALATGERLMAGEASLRVEHAAHASWVLAPGSRARLLSRAGGVLRIELERGTLDAAVLPTEQAEAFVVQAGQTEVAVHGTRFQVSLHGELASVIVGEGEVWVRPVGRQGGAALRAGMRADFVDGVVKSESLQVVPGERVAAAHAALADEASRPAPSGGWAGSSGSPLPVGRSGVEGQRAPESSSARSDGSRVREQPALPPAPPELLDAASRQVSERIQSCFRQHTAGPGELRIEAETQLGLWVQPDGLILEVNLEPPLAPAVEQCVATQLADLNLGASPRGFRVQRDIRLSR